MAYDPSNIFAKILRGEIPCVKVYEDDKTLAFMDVMPEAEGHVLVVPKEPAENILDLSREGASAMMASCPQGKRSRLLFKISLSACCDIFSRSPLLASHLDP